jgi:hypothetical protein
VSVTSRAQFDEAKKFLRAKFDNHPDLKLVNRQLGELQPRSGWSLINELIQNAIDLNATDIKFTLKTNGNLKFQHNASLKEFPLDTRSIIGLCGVAESTKGLNTVGFMGIGFKFFTKFYSFVDISGGDTHFRLKYPKSGDWKEKLQSLHSPEWLDVCSNIEPIYTTCFHFQDPYSEVSSKISDVFNELDLKRFSLFVKKGLTKIIFQDESDETSTKEILGEKKNDDVIVISNDEEIMQILVIGESVTASAEAKTFIFNNRSVDPDLVVDEELVRVVSLVILLKEDESRLTPAPASGELFCLVPLVETTFPFKFGLDADWFMDSERKNLKLDVDSVKWHKQMISPTLPLLIKRYLLSIESDVDKEERKKVLDIFPKFGKDLGDQFKFLGEEDFKSKLTEHLSPTAFILTTKGEVKSPKDVRFIDELPGGDPIYNGNMRQYQITESMNSDTYQEFLNCFKVPLVDRFSISQDTVNYLQYELDLLEIPKPSDVDVAKIRKLWNPKQPSNYLHILDLLSSIWPPENTTLKVIPLKNGEWAALYDENIVFEKLPSEVEEKSLHSHLAKMNSSFESLNEVHESLQQGIKTRAHAWGKNWGDASGNKWKKTVLRDNESLFDSTYKVSHEISLMTDQDEDLSTAILHFALRTNNPLIVNFLISENGMSDCKECLIPEPYANIYLHSENKSRILKASIQKILSDYSEKMDIKEFLIGANLIELIPIEKRTVSTRPDTISRRTGITVGSGTNGPHRSTYASENSTKKNAWTIIDWVWPIPLDEFTPESVSIYLCNPSTELKVAMKKAKTTMRILYFFNKERKVNGTVDTKWIKELKSFEWVKCSDGESRKPSASPIEVDDSTNSYLATLDEDVIKLYVSLGIRFESSLDELSEQECFQYWKTHTVRRPQLFLSKLKSLDTSNEVKLALLLETRWNTNGEIFTSTNLSNFISNPGTKLGGYIGDTRLLDEGLVDYLEEIGHRFPDGTIPFESIRKCISELNKLYQKKRSASIISSLQSCWELIILNSSTSMDALDVLNSQNQVLMLSKGSLYLHPFPEDRRFDLDSNSLIHEQFPTNLAMLRKLADKYANLQLIDDEFEGLHQEVNLTQSLALQMLVRSMDLNIDIFLLKETHLWVFQEDQYQIDIVVKAGLDRTLIYLNRDAKENWIDDLLFLLIQERPEQFNKSTKSIRQLIANYSTPMSFYVPLYQRFCEDLQLEIFSQDNIHLDHCEPELENKADKLKQSQPAKIRIATEKSPVEKETKDSLKEPDKNKEDSKKKAQSQRTITTVESDFPEENERPKSKKFTDKRIGDRAEEIVMKYLRDDEWIVTESNEERKNNEGFDLEAQKDGITRFIEVKGVRGEWKSVSMTHQQGLHFFRTVEKDDGLGKFEYWLCIVDNVLNKDQTDISEDSPTIHPIHLSIEKPKYIFNFGQWSVRNRPDTNF